MSRDLIAYFSRADENYFSGAMKMLKKGNTAVAAEELQSIVGGELFEIKRKQPYAHSYEDCVSDARQELADNARPALESMVDVTEYDTIWLGYPCWCGTMPMPVKTFLEGNDWTGKRIVPFCTNEGSGLGSSMIDLAHLCQGATIGKGLSIPGSEVTNCKTMLTKWVEQQA